MSDQVLYRKYRSTSFDDVVGQDHVVTSLTNAVSSGKLGHAYLFTGPRGTGKTSVARLLARAANCTATSGAKPCSLCIMCRADIGSTIDLIEIDAASNRSIDSIRDLREKVSLAPAMGKFKVYIIDEVHMLTTEAFNALLKTLEEPPAHAIFIMATTEAHKIPDTIISRAQVFSFHPINETTMAARLRKIAVAENIGITDEAIAVIAGSARGGLRDAIGLLDQAAGASAGTEITHESVQALLGFSPDNQVSRIMEAIISNQASNALNVLDQAILQGAQPAQVTVQLIEAARLRMLQAIALAQTGQAAAPSSTSTPSQLDAYRAAEMIERLVDISRSHWPLLSLQTVLVKLALPKPKVPHAALSRPDDTSSTSSRPAQNQASTTHSQVTSAESSINPIKPGTSDVPQAQPDSADITKDLWPKVLVVIKSKNNSLSALLQMYPATFSKNEIMLLPRFNFHRDLFLKPANRQLIEAAASKVYGKTIKIGARVEEDAKAASRRASPKTDPSAELVSSALEILGGEVVD